MILANTTGNYISQIKNLLSQLPSGSYTEINFEKDLAALYSLFTVFVHVPINKHVEAFGQTYIEALAAGVPSVVTLSGIAPDFIVDDFNALVCKYESSESIGLKIEQLLNSSELINKLTQNGLNSIQKFSLEMMMNELFDLYESGK